MCFMLISLQFYFKNVEPVRSVFFFFISRESILVYPPVERSYFRKWRNTELWPELWNPSRHVHKGPPHSTPVDVDPQVTIRWQTDRQTVLSFCCRDLQKGWHSIPHFCTMQQVTVVLLHTVFIRGGQVRQSAMPASRAQTFMLVSRMTNPSPFTAELHN